MARREIAEALDWYRERSARASEVFLDEVESGIERVAESPLRWPAYELDSRRLVLNRVGVARSLYCTVLRRTTIRCNRNRQQHRKVIDRMAEQLTIRLPSDMNRALDEAAVRLRRNRSEVVRLAIEQFLGWSRDETKRADRVRHLIGSIDSGVPDLAENHRTYVLESLKNPR